MAYGIEGEVQSRMDAYRGNPQMLQQKYAQNQELIDLLALQKLKSEKEAAARDMQLKMAQQQAAKGQPPTTKDKLEQEVMGMTKQEIAQQMGGIAQQRQQEQQKKMQQLMQSGVATLPAPGLARMAGGGIVAFAGEDGSYVEGEKKPLDEEAKQELARAQMRGDREAIMDVLRKLGAAGYDVATLLPRGVAGAIDTALVRPARALTGVEIPYLGSVIDTESATPAMDELRRKEAAAKVPVDNRALLNQADAELRSQPAPPVAAAPTPASPVPGTVARPVRPAAAPAAAPAATGIAGIIDPLAKQQTEEERVAKLRGLTPEQRKVYDEGIAELRNIYKEETDPAARRSRELSAFLRGAANRSSFGSVMAGGSAGRESERRRGVAQRLKGAEAVQKKLEDVIGIERAAVGEGIQAGQETGKLAGQIRGQISQSRDRGLDREVEKQKVAVQADANAAMREGTNLSRLQTVLGSVNRTIADIAQKYSKDYTKRIQEKEMFLQGAEGAEAKKLQQEIDQLKAEYEAVVDAQTFDLRRQRDALEASLGGGADTSGFTVRRKE
jgi:hypothetical protein